MESAPPADRSYIITQDVPEELLNLRKYYEENGIYEVNCDE